MMWLAGTQNIQLTRSWRASLLATTGTQPQTRQSIRWPGLLWDPRPNQMPWGKYQRGWRIQLLMGQLLLQAQERYVWNGNRVVSDATHGESCHGRNPPKQFVKSAASSLRVRQTSSSLGFATCRVGPAAMTSSSPMSAPATRPLSREMPIQIKELSTAWSSKVRRALAVVASCRHRPTLTMSK